MDSVFSQKDNRKCYVCGLTYQLHSHHIFPGPDRAVSERLGLKLDLCYQHHSDVHAFPNIGLDKELKQIGQSYYEAHYGTREDFMREFRKSYL